MSPAEPSTVLRPQPCLLPAVRRHQASVLRVILHPLAFILFSLSISLSPLTSTALTQGDYTYTTNALGQATITGFNQNYAGALSITNTLGGCPVTAIGNEAFLSCDSFTAVLIPDSVTDIGFGAFYGCSELASVTIGNGVLSIGESAFHTCGALTSVIIGNSVTSIGDWAFVGCTKLASVSIPNRVTSIGAYAFYNCVALISTAIPASVSDIGYAAFSVCLSLTHISVAPENTAYASDDGVLFNKDFTTLIQFPGGRSESYYAIPNKVASIGGDSFYACTNLTDVTIPNNITSIGNHAFGACIMLASISIPSSITSIGDEAFAYCSSLSAVLFKGDAPSYCGSDVFYDAPATLYYLPAYAANWPATFGGRPTLCWNPAVQRDASFGFASNRFGFNIAGTTNIPVVVQATTNLASGVWTPVTNANLNSSGSLSFADPASSTLPARFYRIAFP